MKHNWEYKPVSEIFDTVTDFVAAGSFADLRENVIYNNEQDFAQLIRTTDLKNNFSNSQFVYVNEHAFNYLWRVNLAEECIILPNIGNCGEVYYLHPSMLIYPNNVLGPNAIMVRSKKHNQKYLAFALKGKYFQRQLFQIVSQVAQSKFNKTNLKKLIVPVPSLEVQERIVAELDKINETIEDCRELLRNLDALSQSLFYDFFGDPITNPKGWPLYKLSSISQLINGRAYKQNELLDEGKYKVIRVGNFFTNSDYYYSDLELSPEKYIDYGDLIFAWSASFGAFIWQGDKVIYHYHIWKVLFDDNLLNKIFYKFLLNEMTSSFMKDLHGIGMMHLTKVGMENYMLPIPPLALQEKFAERIEAIEEQKKAVEQTIAELQTLLDSRMDYWFN